jgi:hypothetical protein
MKRMGLTLAEQEALYQAARRASGWMGLFLECTALSERCERDLLAFMRAIPESWWARFPADDAADIQAACDGSEER